MKNTNKKTEQYTRDVRSVKSDDDVFPKTKADLKESAENDAIQEQNKKSQKNAEVDAKFGDISTPGKSKLGKKS